VSFSKKELETYCDEIILKNAAIDRQTIVLCEGFNQNLKELVKNPATLAENFVNEYQDAAFYQRSIPKWCRDANIVFYVCGKQAKVIEAYFYLRKKYQEKQAKNDRRFDVNKLFAWLDIDSQKHPLPKEEDYPFSSLEAIYSDLYQNGLVNQKRVHNHNIWVTGLLHKEAYFLIPELQEIFDQYHPTDLTDLHVKIAKSISWDKDFYKLLTENFNLVKERINHHPLLYVTQSVEEFQKIWLDEFSKQNITPLDKNALIEVLLIIAKSKTIWESIQSDKGTKAKAHKDYRDQLTFKIANEFYAKQPRDSLHHLPSFFNALKGVP